MILHLSATEAELLASSLFLIVCTGEFLVLSLIRHAGQFAARKAKRVSGLCYSARAHRSRGYRESRYAQFLVLIVRPLAHFVFFAD